MKSKPVIWIVAITLIVVAAMIALTLVLVPENTNPAFAAATEFMTAAGNGDDATAAALLSNTMQTYASENCPEGSVSTCIDDYTPPEWGDLVSVVYRRSNPEGLAWDVMLFAIYEEGEGFAGVCIYHRMEEVAEDDWRVMAWSGFVSCDDSNAGLSGLRQPDAPNRAP